MSGLHMRKIYRAQLKGSVNFPGFWGSATMIGPEILPCGLSVILRMPRLSQDPTWRPALFITSPLQPVWGGQRQVYTGNFILFYLSNFLFIFLERGEGREKERKRNIDVWERNINWFPLIGTSTGDQTQNPSMCPDWELNLWHFALWDSAPPTEPHWSRQAPSF